MKKHRSIGRSKSPADTRPNKLSDHTSGPRKISKNQPIEGRRSSQGGNPFNWKHPQSPANASGDRHNLSSKMFSVESKDFVKCSTKAGDCTSGSRPIIQDRSRTRIQAKNDKQESKANLVSVDSSQKTLKKSIKTKNPKHRELQTKERRKPNKNKDFVLVGQDILAIQNSQQLQNLLKKRKDEQESYRTQQIKNKALQKLEQYMSAFTQYAIYEQERKEYHNALDIMLFHVKDMTNEEKQKLHHKLQKDVGADQTTKQKNDVNNIDTIVKEAMSVIENKEHFVKLVVNKIDQPSSQAANKKLLKVAQWKCKKLRELMAAKTFLQNQKTTIEHTSDPLRCLTQLLQNQFEELTRQENYQLINKLPRDKISAAESKKNNEIAEERETFALENPEFLPSQLMQQIKRAKFIRDAIKTTVDMRVTQQLYEGISMTEGIQTDLMAVNFYLARLTSFIKDNYETHFLQNIKKCYGLNVQSKLKIVRDFEKTLMMEGELPNSEILSNNIFVQFEQKVIGIGETEHDKNIKYYQHVHNKAIFDLFNYFLNSFRPFYQHGQPLPWRSNCQFISSFLITEDNFIDVLQNARYSVLTTIQSLCGLLVDQVPRHMLPQDLTRNEETLIKELMGQQVQSANNEKLKSVMNSELKMDSLKSSLQYFQTYTYLKLCELIYEHIVRQAIDDIILI